MYEDEEPSVEESREEASHVDETPKIHQLIDSVRENNVEKVNRLLEEGVKENGLYECCLIKACERGHLEIAKLLIQQGADVNGSPLYFATQAAEVAAVKLLLDAGADVNYPYGAEITLILEAVKIGHEGLVNVLLQHGASSLETRTHYGYTALILAVRSSNLVMVDALLKAGAEANAVCPRGKNTLMYATDAAVAQKLLDNGCNPNPRCMNGYGCLDYAFSNQCPEVAVLLIKAGADVNAKSPGDLTPLFEALLHWLPNMVEMLVEYGADVTFINSMNRGAIYHTAAIPDPFICRYLIEKGAEPDTVSTDGSTPIYISVSRHNIPVAKLLLENNVRLDRLYFHTRYVQTHRIFPNTRYTLLDIAIQEELPEFATILYDLGCPVVEKKFNDNDRYPQEIKTIMKLLNQPRTLVNLARNSVRKYLGLRLLRGISSLGLPPYLVELVLITKTLS